MATAAVMQDLAVHLEPSLARVRLKLAQAIASREPAVHELSKLLDRYRGKMLRPSLVLLAGQACGHVNDSHYTLAAVVELVHMATLVHDDVLDEAEVRRGQITMHRLHGNEAAVLLGDYLFSHAYRLCSTLDRQHASMLVASTAARLCEGELLQNLTRGRLDLTLDEYFQIIRGKTAELVATSCELGAWAADADDSHVDALSEYGMQCGIAFQIVDDVLDITGTERALGKRVGRDVDMGKLTLPVIWHLNHVDDAGRRRAAELLGQGQRGLAELRAELEKSEAIDAAADMARAHVSKAIQCLSVLPDSPARETLEAMAELIVTRHA